MSSEPIVQNGHFTCEEISVPLTLSDPSWLEWLEAHKKFKYKSDRWNFTAFKDGHGYWIAQKRLNGILRQKRLGNSLSVSRLSEESFNSIASLLCSSRYLESRRESSPDYLNHRIDQLQLEIQKWKDEVYSLRQAIAAKEKSLESYSKTLSLTREQLGEAVETLNAALKLKPNAGGAIKTEIRKVIAVLEQIS